MSKATTTSDGEAQTASNVVPITCEPPNEHRKEVRTSDRHAARAIVEQHEQTYSGFNTESVTVERFGDTCTVKFIPNDGNAALVSTNTAETALTDYDVDGVLVHALGTVDLYISPAEDE